MNLKLIWTTTKKLWLLYFDFYIVSQMLPTRKWQNLLAACLIVSMWPGFIATAPPNLSQPERIRKNLSHSIDFF
jgi:hypothetical protein